MKFVELIQIIKLVPQSRAHVKKIARKLNNTEHGYETTLNGGIEFSSYSDSVFCSVKSYFWACRFLKNHQCLPRSIALYQYLKAAGFKNVEHKFGVNKTEKSFHAHAWVEHNNRPLNESKDLLTKFKVLEKT